MSVEKANYPVALMCRVLEVSRSGFYASTAKVRPTPRESADAELVDEIRRIHEASRGTYGRPRVLAQLHRDGHEVGKGRVARLMNSNGIKGRVRRKYRSTTDSNHQRPVAPNLLNREFTAETPDSAWCADITQFATASGSIYLAVVLDLATRLVVGWSMASHMRTELVESALANALSWRAPAATLVHHSDRGSQYASDSYQRLLERHGITSSMSRKGDCWDNAAMESFFGTLKQEWAHHHWWRGLLDARASVHDYIEVFYNRQRLHSSLGYRTPEEVDRASA
jgi:putative transposase